MTDKVNFYMDEHISNAIIKGLQRRGIDVLTTNVAGMLGASDEEQLLLATTKGRTLFTQDDDFLRLHSRGIQHCGIVYAQQKTPISNIISGLLLIHQVLYFERE